MTNAVRPLIAGNWKMNGLQASMPEFEAMLRGAPEVLGKADLLVCPPATLLAPLAWKAKSFGQEGDRVVTVGAQDCHAKASGAHTGDVSAEMPVMGFYLQPAVGGRVLGTSFWRRLAALDNVVAKKLSPFNS